MESQPRSTITMLTGQPFGLQTGDQRPGRPSFGAWASYGLGSETRDLPAFVVLTSVGKRGTRAAMDTMTLDRTELRELDASMRKETRQ